MSHAETNRSQWPDAPFALTLFVDDLAGAKAFYTNAFALDAMYEDDDSVVFRFGPTMINLLRTSAVSELIEPAVAAPSSSGARLLITLHVDDVDAMCAQLQARGVTLLNGPIDRPWGPRTASFADECGYVWEFAS
jgi:catechol 2,3-dioxygenase-like lactoylglutathione lyase family enzyme